jgi:hypothetical protein
MDLSSVNKHSSRDLALSTVFWSALGGIEIGRGLQQLIHAKLHYDWITSFLFGPTFVCYGIFWAVMLVRRISTAQVQSPKQV